MTATDLWPRRLRSSASFCVPILVRAKMIVVGGFISSMKRSRVTGSMALPVPGAGTGTGARVFEAPLCLWAALCFLFTACAVDGVGGCACSGRPCSSNNMADSNVHSSVFGRGRKINGSREGIGNLGCRSNRQQEKAQAAGYQAQRAVRVAAGVVTLRPARNCLSCTCQACSCCRCRMGSAGAP